MTNIKCPSLSLLIYFSLKSILLDIKVATTACLLDPFDWKKIFLTLYSEWCLFLRLRCVSYMQQKDGFYFRIRSVSLCLFISELSPFILRDINDQWLLSPVNLVFIVGDVNLCVFPFFGIYCCKIINCLCFCEVANLLVLEFPFYYFV